MSLIISDLAFHRVSYNPRSFAPPLTCRSELTFLLSQSRAFFLIHSLASRIAYAAGMARPNNSREHANTQSSGPCQVRISSNCRWRQCGVHCPVNTLFSENPAHNSQFPLVIDQIVPTSAALQLNGALRTRKATSGGSAQGGRTGRTLWGVIR